MADGRGFLKIARQDEQKRVVCERVQDFKNVMKLRPEKQSQEQSSRCMDCATPFCHWACPIGNFIPEWNHYSSVGNWDAALKLLDETNNLPEITGRVCPALCEYSCVLGINDEAVTIRENELAIVEYGFKKGLIKPVPPKDRTGKNIAVVGSGPAGMSCAAQLNRAGHSVVVFEKDDNPGGILRYGIPDFKLEKHLIDRRVNLWKKEGIVFKTGTEAGKDYSTKKLLREFDAVCLAGGSRIPRDLKIDGRELKGIYFAMDYLIQANKNVSGGKNTAANDPGMPGGSISADEIINAKNKTVVVIGGGDTGADCVGVARRQNARCVVQIEIMAKPPECRNSDYPWPRYPLILKTSSSHEEGCERHWSILTKRFSGEKGFVRNISCVRIEFLKQPKGNCALMKEIPGTEFEIKTDMVILAMGFLHPQYSGLLSELNVGLDERGNVKTDKNYMTSVDKVFSAGDMRRGQSLVVWAVSEGRRCAYCIDRYLMGASDLPLM